MVRLSKEELQFIDNYLDNSDVVYADIRMEITDHVASEIETKMKANSEATFYDVFKAYMVENKAELLNDNKRFIKTVVSQNTKLIFKELVSFKTIIVFMLLLFLSNNYLVDTIVMSTKHLFAIPIFLMVIIAIIYYGFSKLYKLSRFSGVERLGFMYSVLFQFFYFVSIIIQPRIEYLNSIIISIIFAICITLIYVFVKVTIQLMKTYFIKYKSIA